MFLLIVSDPSACVQTSVNKNVPMLEQVVDAVREHLQAVNHTVISLNEELLKELVGSLTLEDEDQHSGNSEVDDSKSYRSLFSAHSTPQTWKGVQFSTSKRWLAAWLIRTNRYACDATRPKFTTDCAGDIEFAYIFLEQSTTGTKTIKTISYVSHPVFPAKPFLACLI